MHQPLTFAILCVLIMILPGWLGRRSGHLTEAGTRDLAKLLMQVFYPCMIFNVIFTGYSIRALRDEWILPALAAGILLFGLAAGLAVGRLLHFRNPEEQRAFHLQATLNNYSFLPLALVVALFDEQTAAALLLSTLGAELIVWTAGIAVLTGHGISRKSIRHLFSAPLLALYAALLLRAVCEQFGWMPAFARETGCLPALLLHTLKTIGLATVPISMIIAGSRIAAMRPAGLRRGTVWTLTLLRMVIIPLALLLLLNLLPIDPVNRRVLMIVACMPCAMASLMLSEIFGGDHDFITATVLLTHLLGLLTIPLLLTFFL